MYEASFEQDIPYERSGGNVKVEIDVSNYATKADLKGATDIDTSKITKIENKIPYVTGLVTSATLNTKATEIENKIPDVTYLATKATLNTKATEKENKSTDTSTLVKKTEYNTNIVEIEEKISDVSNFDKKTRKR